MVVDLTFLGSDSDLLLLQLPSLTQETPLSTLFWRRHKVAVTLVVLLVALLLLRLVLQ